MGKPGDKYRPSSGSEGMYFMEEFCEQCARDKYLHGIESDDDCEIISRTMLYDKADPEYPTEWTYTDGGTPTCTAFIPDNEDVPYRCEGTVDMFDKEAK